VAIKSAINPTSIVKNKPVSFKSFQNFVTGGSDLGTSAVASAANKIVGFQRGSTGVSPKVPDLGSIIQTLSTNILNNVEGKVSSINKNVNTVVNKYIQKLESNYQQKMQSIDVNGPSKLLENFLSLYEKAIGYIQFFANPRNIKNLEKNLSELRNVFAETFEVAKNIRKTIVRVVNQLSNLPTANAGGGGINLDLKLPGAPLRKAGAPMARRVRGRGLLGAAALGGAAGLVTSALASPGGGEQISAGPSESGGGLSGPILDKFSAILDRFSQAISDLSKPKAAPKAGGGSGKSSAPKSSEQTSPGAGAGASGSAAVTSAPGDQKLAAFAATMEAGSPENASDAMQVMLNRAASGYSKQGLAGVISSREQFSPISAAIYGTSADKAAAAKYGPLAQKLGKTPDERFKKLQEIAALPDGLNKLQQLFGGGSANVAATVLNDPKYLEMSRQNVKGALNFYGGSKQKAGDVQFRSGGNWFYNFTGKVGSLGTQPSGTVAAVPKGTVAPASTQAVTQQQIAQQVSQPAVVQTQPQVNVVPLNMGQQGSRGVQKPPTTSVGQASASDSESTIPMLNSSNEDNFLTLYSKMVYNIVDG
jgi:hypothetical protein